MTTNRERFDSGELLPPQPEPRIRMWRYMSAAAAGLYPVIAVATEGGVNDWAAYVAGVGHGVEAPDDRTDPMLAWVASYGHKLTEDQARGFFPAMYGTYRQ